VGVLTEKVRNAPQPLGHARSHCRSPLEATMNAAEIVVEQVQGHGRAEIVVMIPFAPKIVGNTKTRFSGRENVRSRFAKSGLALERSAAFDVAAVCKTGSPACGEAPNLQRHHSATATNRCRQVDFDIEPNE
jgi:hypothetical protein